MSDRTASYEGVLDAARQIAPAAVRTPLIESPALNERLGGRVLLKAETMQVAGAWGGLIDVTPDAVPVIGEVPRIPGFFLASGFSGHGFGIGPGAGRLVADLLTGTTPFVDMAPFRLERFARLRRTTT